MNNTDISSAGFILQSLQYGVKHWIYPPVSDVLTRDVAHMQPKHFLFILTC